MWLFRGTSSLPDNHDRSMSQPPLQQTLDSNMPQYNPLPQASEHMHESRRHMLETTDPATMQDVIETQQRFPSMPLQINNLVKEEGEASPGPLQFFFDPDAIIAPEQLSSRASTALKQMMQDALDNVESSKQLAIEDAVAKSKNAIAKIENEYQQLMLDQTRLDNESIHSINNKADERAQRLTARAVRAEGRSKDLESRLGKAGMKYKDQSVQLDRVRAQNGKLDACISNLQKTHSKDVNRIEELEEKLAEVIKTSKDVQSGMATRIATLEKQHSQDTSRIKMLLAVKADLQQDLAECRQTNTDMRNILADEESRQAVIDQGVMLDNVLARVQQLESQLNSQNDMMALTTQQHQAQGPDPDTVAAIMPASQQSREVVSITSKAFQDGTVQCALHLADPQNKAGSSPFAALVGSAAQPILNGLASSAAMQADAWLNSNQNLLTFREQQGDDSWTADSVEGAVSSKIGTPVEAQVDSPME